MLNVVCTLIVMFKLMHAVDVTFFVFSRNNPNVPFVFNGIDVDDAKPLKILIHGWLNRMVLGYFFDMKDEYLKKEDCFVVMMDWSRNNGDFLQTTVQVRLAGKVLGETLLKYYKNSFNGIHLIGQGLGSHLAGFAGKEIAKYSDNKIARITGLDPTLPRFNNSPPSDRLDQEDAEFVDVYHCDSYRFGYGDPIGDVDFYPNGGRAPMDGCTDVNQTLLELMYTSLDDAYCTHNKCRKFFTKSINTKEFKATKCDSWQAYINGTCRGNEEIVFGENVPQTSTGCFYNKMN